jgi:hypothetical protein
MAWSSATPHTMKGEDTSTSLAGGEVSECVYDLSSYVLALMLSMGSLPSPGAVGVCHDSQPASCRTQSQITKSWINPYESLGKSLIYCQDLETVFSLSGTIRRTQHKVTGLQGIYARVGVLADSRV